MVSREPLEQALLDQIECTVIEMQHVLAALKEHLDRQDQEHWRTA